MNQAERNLQEWNRLYQSTSERIWGEEPIGFLPEFIPKLAMSLTSNSILLDAGTGEGRNLKLIAELPGKLHAVDGSESALSKIPDSFRKKIMVQQAMLDILPYENDTFDLIFGIDIFETLPNIHEVLREFVRVMKPGGRMICNIPSEEDTIYGIDMAHPDDDADAFLYQNKYYYRFYPPNEVQTMFKSAGMRIVEEKRYEWTEKAHPNFRSNDHTHVSQVYSSQKI
ncbi:MAG: methyltransferase domain-containing protein [Balneolales bacterium]|nr:methyltransferase domain-containing protein [Balneolales bacterium]